MKTLSLFLLALSGAVLVAACDPKPPVFQTVPECSTQNLAAVNAAYQAQYQEIWDTMTRKLTVSSVAPITDEDRKRAAIYQARMRRLEREINDSYKSAVQSCEALQECETYNAGTSYAICDTRRGDMMITRSAFFAIRGELDARAAEIQSYDPYADVPFVPLPPKKPHDYRAHPPSVNRGRDCPTVSDVLTVCDDYDEGYDHHHDDHHRDYGGRYDHPHSDHHRDYGRY